jgi:hypothetical protein
VRSPPPGIAGVSSSSTLLLFLTGEGFWPIVPLPRDQHHPEYRRQWTSILSPAMRPSGGLVKRTLTRRDFLKVAGTGAAGTALLGGSGCGKGTGKMQVDRTNVNKTYVEGLNVIL